jgi:hypothetical protein
MKFLVQWTTDPPTDWVEYDITSLQDFKDMPKKPVPVGGEIIDALPGWVMAVDVQGLTLTGWDHYTADIVGDGLAVIVWNDDVAAPEFQGFIAKVWTFLIPKHDPIVNLLNTDQRLDVYTDTNPGRWDGQTTTAGPVVVHPWADFTIPKPANRILHGINVEDALFDAHKAVRTVHGWEEWV